MPDIEAAWVLARRVADPRSGVWPVDGWPPMLLDGGLAVGSRGGHGGVRYRVTEVVDDRFRFVFTDRPFDGFHEFRRDGDVLVHVLELRRPSLLVRRGVVPLHDAVLEELFDDIEDLLAGRSVPRPRHRSPFVRVVRRLAPA